MQNRIREVRKALHMTQADFGAKIGVRGNTVTGYENGQRVPSDAVIVSICREFHVDEHWLRTGDGEMRQKLTRNQEIAEFMGVVMHDPDDAPRKRFVSIISKLSADEWQLLAEIAKKMAEDE